MKSFFTRWTNDERGVTALETAIILIAFVVVAAIFAFTILTTGTFLTERAKEAGYAGLAEVRGSMELRGSVVVTSTATASTTVDYAMFTIANVAGGQPVNLNDANTKQVVSLVYRDKNQSIDLNNGAKWTVSFIGSNNGDKILDPNELAQLTVDLTSLNPQLATNQTFDIELKPPQGAVLLIERTTPSRIDPVTDLK